MRSVGYVRCNLNVDNTLDVTCSVAGADLLARGHFTPLDGWRYEALIELSILTAELANGAEMSDRDRRALTRMTKRTKASTDD